MDTEGATTLRAHLSRDRQSVLVQGNHVLWRVSIDGETQEELPIDNHHDFLELADGTLVVLDQVEEQIGDVTVIGDWIVEYAPSGESRVVWTTFDSFEYDPDALLEFPDMFMGWSHANVLRYDAERDRYAVSVRNFHTIVTIDRETGEELYRIGGTDSDVVSSTGETALFYGQHGFQLESDRLLIYDNGSPERNSTMIVEFGIDLDAGTADRHFDYKPDPPLYNPVAGDVTRLPSGNTLITWSYLGRIEELSPDGAIVGQIQMPIGNGFGYTSWVEDLYTATDTALTPGEADATASAR
ncbi:MAG: aryl-sulfate sulfotransferase [Myxococcota bacterium]|nr:aryl-sulfate sulfotransferase [Myxococcota bacterium]